MFGVRKSKSGIKVFKSNSWDSAVKCVIKIKRLNDSFLSFYWGSLGYLVIKIIYLTIERLLSKSIEVFSYDSSLKLGRFMKQLSFVWFY